MSAQEQRERTLAVQSSWVLHGRLAISGPEDGGSGALEWSQDEASFRFSVSAPVTGKTWTLSGDPEHAELAGLRAQPVFAADAASLLERELGWKVPVIELSSWVRAIRAPGPADIVFRADGLPAEFRQNGWTIEYRDYETTHEPKLPRRIFASNGDYKVRLLVHNWALQ